MLDITKKHIYIGRSYESEFDRSVGITTYESIYFYGCIKKINTTDFGAKEHNFTYLLDNCPTWGMDCHWFKEKELQVLLSAEEYTAPNTDDEYRALRSYLDELCNTLKTLRSDQTRGRWGEEPSLTSVITQAKQFIKLDQFTK